MGSVFTGWWSWLVALWALAFFTFAVIALFSDEGDEGDVERFAFIFVLFGLAAVTAAALVVRRKAPRLAAWLLIVGVGLPGLPSVGSVRMLIPTAIALVIIIGGVKTGEIRFTRPE